MGEGSILERDEQLRALTGYAAEAADGDGRLVLISGEAGIGKSTLVEALAEHLSDGPWWWGACDGLSTPRPLGPLLDIASEVGGPLVERCTPDAPREVAFTALVDAIAASATPPVIVIEDVHWADEATFDFLRFLGRRLSRTDALALVTFRDDSLGPAHPLRLVLGDLARQRATRRMALGPLSPAAVATLAEGSGCDPVELHRLTGGSPYFVAEVLTGLPGDGIPASARDAVLARAAGLDDAHRRTLERAALAGTRFDPDLVLAPPEADAAHLDALLHIGLLVPAGRRLGFRHEIARQAMAESVAPHRAVELHGQLLDALLDQGCTDATRLAHHGEGAGRSDVVVTWAPRAGRTASALAAHREAADQFARALRHADGVDAPTRAMLHDDLGEQLACIERWDEALIARRTAAELWRAEGDARREGDSLHWLGVVLWRLCRGDESIAVMRRARELLEPLGATTELCSLLASGADGVTLPELDRHVRRAHELAVELDDELSLVDALNAVAYVESRSMGDYTTPLEHALRLAHEVGEPMQVARTYSNFIEYLISDQRFDVADDLLAVAIPYCDERDVAVYGNCVRCHHHRALLDQGRWADLEAIGREHLARGTSPVNRLTTLVALGLLAARRDDPAAEALLAEADRSAAGIDEPEWRTLAGLARVEACLLRGDADTARDVLRQVRGRLVASDRREASAVAVWQHRLGVAVDTTPVLATHVVEVTGSPRDAAEAWDAVGMPYDAALALAGSDDEVDLREALDRLDRLNAPAASRVVRRRMRNLGMRAVPVGARATTRADPHGLTRREREVLDLVAEGLTNEQIADRLVIAVKTVDHHVSSVLTKLGVASRQQAVAAVATAKAG